ncbi:hypothetical protein EDB81DRAFT_927124 [Dactylonectria macrodidyma]|uniref:Uncharacterized protein n=1 Tax=Dactylonectria macrodidyma TaxID=307937 RepID=A0A9P9I783_9HYPO|nr:hypothetical protein EDB81DRAFT_927124 [Dactylonectria macrodidyma]
MSSPTLEAITNVRNVVAEAALMHREREAFSADRLNCLEKYGKRRKTGQQVRPSSDFITSVGFPDIQAQHEASMAAAEVKEQRAQLRSTRMIILQEINAFKARWREGNESRKAQSLHRLTFNQWLEQTENSSRYASLEDQRKEHNEVLSQRPKRAFSEAQEQALRAPRPIIAIDQHAWPDSDDEVEFRGIRPFEDDDDDVELIGLSDLGGDDLPGAGTPLEITSSPPLDLADPADDSDDDNLMSPQLPVTTPRISGYQHVKNVMRELREEQASTAARAISPTQGHNRQLRKAPRNRRLN